MKTTVVILGLALILLANIIMVYYAPYGVSPLEAFQNVNAVQPIANATAAANMASGAANASGAAANMASGAAANMASGAAANMASGAAGNMATQQTTVEPAPNAGTATEGFASYSLDLAGGARDMYKPIGAFDGIKLSTGNSVSGWRYTAPNESLMGAEFEPGPDSLFMFKNNQCKPECCGASFSCGGGCVCTTPQQRQYIAGRGGNRTSPEDSA